MVVIYCEREKERKNIVSICVHMHIQCMYVQVRVCVCDPVSIFRHVNVPPQAILFFVTMEMTEPNCQFALEKKGKRCAASVCLCVCAHVCVRANKCEISLKHHSVCV